jgi:hypothetical protein
LPIDVRAVNRTVVYRSAVGRLRPSVMTAVGVGTLADLRVGHHGETYLAVPKWLRSAPSTPGWLFNR